MATFDIKINIRSSCCVSVQANNPKDALCKAHDLANKGKCDPELMERMERKISIKQIL